MIFPTRFSNQIKPMALIFKMNMKQNLKRKNVKEKLLCKPYLHQQAQEIGWHYTQQVLSWLLLSKYLITEHQAFLFVIWKYLFCIQTLSNSVLAAISFYEKGQIFFCGNSQMIGMYIKGCQFPGYAVTKVIVLL